MSPVETFEVEPDEADLRLDRWFKRRFPGLNHGHIEKLLRTGQVRLDGGRAKANTRLAPGQRIRVPPLALKALKAPRAPVPVKEADLVEIRSRVIYRDDFLIAIDKPPGLAVQGGTKVSRHLDALLDGLRFGGAERPRLVHRLDKDTSGVLLLARNRRAAAAIAAAFRRKEIKKVYWALVAGVPKPRSGRIDLSLAKRAAPLGERMAGDERQGRSAVTRYRVIDAAGRRCAWLALFPETGRTHQLRAHCAALGVPIVGDAKYGGARAFLKGLGLSRKLHLHARAIEWPHPSDGRRLRLSTPLPDHMAESWALLGFDPAEGGDPFRNSKL